MANKLKHYGLLKPTVPNPTIIWGSVQELADHCKITRRAMVSILNGRTGSTRSGYRRMTEEEEIVHYQPPKPPAKKASTRKTEYKGKKHWKITFFKDWRKGENYPTESCRRYTGTPQDFSRFVNCNQGMIYRLLNTHEGLPEKYPLRSVKGWTIARVRRYSKPHVRKARIIKEA